LGNGKIRQRKNKTVGKKGNKKLMSEITATEKTATGKMGNGKWATDVNGEETVTRRQKQEADPLSPRDRATRRVS